MKNQMNSLIQLNKTTWLFCIALLLACFGPSPGVQATDVGGVLPGGNNADGFRVLTNLTTGGFNTGAGWFSLFNDQTGSFNTAYGAATLFSNTADQNTATGAAALFSNTAGSLNTATGAFALFANTTGDGNTAIGANTLPVNTTGAYNTAVGFGAGLNQTSGRNNIYIGDVGAAGESNVIAIGHSPSSEIAYHQFFVGAVYGVTTTSGITLPVLVSDSGQLGTAPSAARFKKEIKPMDKVSESVLALKPVTFHYKSDKSNTAQFGLVAEDVATVNPDLVVRDKNGDIYSVRYEAVNAMLLNEFLKEHRTVQKQKATIAQLKQDFQATVAQLTKRLDEQAVQIQKVSAQIEMSKATPNVVFNNQ